MKINFIYVVDDLWESIMLSLFSGDHNAIFSLMIITVRLFIDDLSQVLSLSLSSGDHQCGRT